MKKYKTKDVKEFMIQSNAIESVYSDFSLKLALDAWEYLSAQKEMTVAVVLKTHKILMNTIDSWSEPELKAKYRGKLRDCPVYIGGKPALEHQKVTQELEQWCKQMNDSQNYTRIIDGESDNFEAVSKNLHIEYEAIHPFADGNGRTGRMFMNWWRMQVGLPILIIHADWPEYFGEQMTYYRWFK